MTYDPQDPRITAYVFDELDAAERAAFENELQQSESLREAVRQVRETLAALTDDLAAEPFAGLAPERRARVDEAIKSATESAPAHGLSNGYEQVTTVGNSIADRARSWRMTVARRALAASILLGCGFLSGTYWGAQRGGSPDQVSSLDRASHRVDATSVQPSVSTAPQSEEASSDSTSIPRTPPRYGEAQYLAAGPVDSGAASSPAPYAMASASTLPLASPGPSAAPAEKQAGPTPTSAAVRVVTGSKRLADSKYEAAPVGEKVRELDRLQVLRRNATPERLASGQENAVTSRAKHSGRGVELTDLEHARQRGVDEALAQEPADRGGGPGTGGDKFDPIVENDFREVKVEPLSTFSIDVDTASYSKIRQYLMQQNSLPRPDAVRIEELVNYFTYDYQAPQDETPFAANVEVAACPWAARHRLVRIGIKGREMERTKRPTSNLVFLLDVSGSMNEPNKLPLVKHGMKMLVNELGENDRVAIVVYAGAAGLVLPSTSGDRKQTIIDSLDQLQAGGSTNGGEGIRLAYQTALDNFVQGGVNRVILCSDGDFNVGVTGTDELVRLAVDNAKTGVFLSVLGFGMGNHNDSMMEQISNKGNGNYAFIDTELESRKVLVEQMSGTLVTIAKDVKIQVEFNPLQVAAFRLIGYENRILAAQDFNDDKKDAGEIGAGHTVTALYEIVPTGAESNVQVPAVDELKYQRPATVLEAASNGELLTLKLRYKRPDGDKSALLSFPVKDSNHQFGQASRDFRFAASVASFGMLLRDSKYQGDLSLAGVLEIATEAADGDKTGYRTEFLKMVAKAKQLRGE